MASHGHLALDALRDGVPCPFLPSLVPPYSDILPSSFLSSQDGEALHDENPTFPFGDDLVRLHARAAKLRVVGT